MQKRSIYGSIVGVLALLCGWTGRSAEATWNYAVQVSATVDAAQPKIVLNWPQDTVTTPNSYTVYRKALNASTWGNGVSLPGSATTYSDTSVQPGTAYEYQIHKVTSTHNGYGYIAVGVNAPIVERRGKVVLVVDASQASPLSAELTRLQSDLVGDGWTVARQDVQRDDSPANVKNVIKAAYNADPSNVKAVFLFGHVPVPYSGNIVPDGHAPDHQGAWPADAYYGDMDGGWSDNSVYNASASEARNRNVPGDGKFDQSTLPSDVDLQVGRVDLANMPGRKVWGGPATFSSETELLRNYLNKDHNFRHKKLTAPARALVHDTFGGRGGEAFAASAFRSYAPLFGANNTTSVEPGLWINTLANNQYLAAYGCGGGSYSSIVGLGNTGPYKEGTTVELVEADIKSVFTMLMGSWLGDWDSEDNIMRAVLATRSMGLSCSWSGRPHWFYHHLGLGETLGYSARLTQNNGSGGLYRNQINSAAGGIHVALMGDPTLRLHAVAPVSNLQATSGGANVNLTWTGSSDSVAGYHVYRASSASGPFTRVTTTPITQTTYSDTGATAGANTYMVRAVKLENTTSGSYYNQSQGIFATASSTGGSGSGNTNTNTLPDSTAPVISLTAPANNSTVSGSAVTLSANATDNTAIAGVQFKLDGANLGVEDKTAPYSIVWNSTSVANGSHTLTAVARDDAGNQTTASAVTLLVSNGSSGSTNGTPTGTVWVDDSLPAGAIPAVDGDLWNWVGSNPAPYSGAKGHQSIAASGLHQHYFDWASSPLEVGVGEVLYAYVYVDPANPPSQIMLQWNDGSWEHRAYWGANRILYGADGGAGRKYIGPVPNAGQWIRLEVPAKDVGLEGRSIRGMAFSLFDGRVTWDAAGKSGPGTGGGSTQPPDSTPPTIAISAPANNASVSGASVQISASASDNVGVVGVQFKLNGQNLQAEDVTAPFGLTWNSTTISNGAYTLTAVARDAAGNQATSSPVTLQLNNTNTPPSGGATNSVPGNDTKWFDDVLPTGAVMAADGNDSWSWVSSSPTPFSGSKVHQSSLNAGLHQHYFDWASQTMDVGAGEWLYAYVYLDPANPPSQIMLQWNDGLWDHRAYWGANRILYGVDGSSSRKNMGALPAAGQWARLEVSAKDVGLEGKRVRGMAFSLFDGRAAWDVTGKSTSTGSTNSGNQGNPSDTTAPTVAISQPGNNASVSNGNVTITANASDNVGVAGVQFKVNGANIGNEDTTAPYSTTWAATTGAHTLTAVARDAAGNVQTSASVSVTVTGSSGSGNEPNPTDLIWVEDSLPTGAVPNVTGADTWSWVSSNPTPFSGRMAHQSALSAGLHQHYFDWAGQTMDVGAGEWLYAYVYLDPANPPSQIMLQWNDGLWDHRAYWGANKISYGFDGSDSRRNMGALPAAGQWIRLEVPAKSVGLEGKKVRGMAFSCFDGRATWDAAGKSSVSGAGSNPTEAPTVTVDLYSDAAIEELPNSGTFTFNRAGNLANPLSVQYTFTGTAINGTDYTFPASIIIPAGVAATNVSLTLLDDALADGEETVILTLSPNSAYKIGSPSHGTIIIVDADVPPGGGTGTNGVPGGTNSVPPGTNAGPEISVTDYTGLRLPKTGDYALHVLTPTLLELQLINSKQPDPARVATWDFVDANNQFKAPASSEFNVKINGANASVQSVGFKRRVLYAPVAVRDLRILNSLYLKLDRPVSENQTVEVLNPSGALWNSATKFQAKAERLRYSPAIHVNQEGYVPAFAKKAMVGYYTGNLGEMDVPTSGGFQIVDADSGAQVYQGALKIRNDVGFGYSPTPYQKVCEADFSSFKTPGEYRLVVPGLGASLPFLIDEGIAMNFARTYALGLYHQRCGAENGLPHTRHDHAKCHTAAADAPVPQSSYQFTWTTVASKTADYASNPRHTAPRMVSEATQRYPIQNRGKLDVSGGHHDAGDYSKYTINSAGLVHYLMFAVDSLPGVAALDNLGLPESGDGISDILQEAKWEADYLAKIQDADGGFYFLVYPRDREYEWGVTPDNGDPQVVWPKNTAATAGAVAALAQTASSPKFKQRYPAEAAKYLEKAKLGWKFLTDAITKYGKDGAYQKITHYGNEFMHDDELAWAACEMFLATGEETYHTALKQWFDPSNPDTFRWGWWRLNESYGNAVRAYAFAARSGRLPVSKLDAAYLAKCEQQVVLCAQDQLKRSTETAYGSSFPMETKAIRTAGWYFSSERAFDLAVGHQIEPRQEFIDAIVANMNYEGGCNPVNVSYVTGLGWKRQRDVVHQFALADRRALPPSGIPVGNIVGSFQYQDNYKQELNSLDFPDDDAPTAPYPLYDRWGDSWNVYAEFVHLDQARSLASLAFLATLTDKKSQAWRSATATIVVPQEIEIGKPTTVTVQASVDLNGARVVWEARDQEPGFGSQYSITPRSSGNYWIEAEIQWPDGRRAFASTSTVADGATVSWVDDELPAGAVLSSEGGDTWNWIGSNPAPQSGSLAHQSAAAAGMHQHWFSGATSTLQVNPGDKLFAYVYLDPANPPTQIMLQWNDGSWDHRAYWGANSIQLGSDNTASRRYVGPLPAAGQWVRLEVPASQVGLEGKVLQGMAFTLYGGRATWDNAGRAQ